MASNVRKNPFNMRMKNQNADAFIYIFCKRSKAACFCVGGARLKWGWIGGGVRERLILSEFKTLNSGGLASKVRVKTFVVACFHGEIFCRQASHEG